MNKDKLYRCFYNAKQRCGNSNDRKYKYYGGKGIKFLLSLEEIKQIWIRDNAKALSIPSLDRINPQGNYDIDNCRFIEFKENVSRRFKIPDNLPLYMGIEQCPECNGKIIYSRVWSNSRVCRRCGFQWIYKA